ncbi:MAG: hypothetical protein ABI199_08480 [Bacteroidia bacterium]
MEIFKSELSQAQIIKKGIVNTFFKILLFNLICLIVSDFGTKKNEIWWIFNTLIILLIGLNVLKKRNRNVLKIIFNEDEKSIHIEYLKYFLKKEQTDISFKELGFYFGQNTYGRGALTLTLVFFKNRKYLFEIKCISNVWDWEKVKEVQEKLKLLATNLKYPNGSG